MKIIGYKFKNFCSFKEEQEVSFKIPKSAAEDCLSYESGVGFVNSTICVLGHNGSGKTNLLKPLPFLAFMLSSSFHLSKDDELPFSPFAGLENEESEIEVEYETNSQLLKYKIVFNQDSILTEEISIKTTSRYSYIVKRVTRSNGTEVKFKAPNNSVNTRFWKNFQSNISVMSALLTIGESKQEDIISEYVAPLTTMIKANISEYGKNHVNMSSIITASEKLYEDPDKFELLKEIMLDLDLGLDDIRLDEVELIAEAKEKSEKVIMPKGVHIIENSRTLELPFTRESSGTQSLFLTISRLLDTLECGGISVLDEMDSDLHSYMLKKLIDLFLDESLNKKHAQLIFTSHTPEILNDLNKYQLYLVEKIDGVSSTYRADCIDGLRSDDNLYKKYVSGSLGAVPIL